jgi:hypothetical protein
LRRLHDPQLNEGVSGEGNASVDLSNLSEPIDPAIAERVRAMRFELGTVRFDDYAAMFRARGGVVEERVGIGAQDVRSPSVQLRITPLSLSSVRNLRANKRAQLPRNQSAFAP